MTLKEQIEATIKEYQDACKPENLNIGYCVRKFNNYGICYFCKQKNFTDLYHLIEEDSFVFLTHQPIHITRLNNYPKILLKIHKIRIKYLKNLLKQIKSKYYKQSGILCPTEPTYFL